MKKLLFLILILVLSLDVNAQEFSGKIIDNNNTPLSDVLIYNDLETSHTHTDTFGNFSFSNVKNNTVFKITRLGFKTISYKYTGQNYRVSIVLEDEYFNLSEVTISPFVDTNSTLMKLDLNTNPVNSSQEILRKIPGLFIGQHAGGGKAEQLFLRGFDIDHGTDIAITTDGIPVNMVSHAHGQGYADLHFVIPETINKIDFGKGPYNAAKGNFATAGYVDFSSKDKIDESKISIEIGQFNTVRTVGLFNLLEKKSNSNAYIATEYIETDGPFNSPQNFNRFNVFGKYTTILENQTKLTFIASHFTSRWDASGQIPMRLVNNGTISRFGAVDDTEGGLTSRTNLAFSMDKIISENSYIKTNGYFSKYDFLLFSNFTFFLNDPVNGDQIKQNESRTLYGFNSEVTTKFKAATHAIKWQNGVAVKVNTTKNSELSNTLNRNTVLNYVQLGDINESNFSAYSNAEFQFNKLLINPSIRLDYFQFNYQDKLAQTYKTLSNNKYKLLPKLNFSYAQNDKLVYFLKTGLGFHSNDSRVVLQESKEVLPGVFGTDIGTIWKPSNSVIINASVWSLFSKQEFVYVGDAGIVEPSGKSRRVGADFGIRYQLNDYLFLDFDANYAHARSVDEEKGNDYIPLAPKWTSVGGISLKNYKRFSGNINYRYIGDRAANEDNSVIAKGYFVSDLSVNYNFTKAFNLGIIINNIFDTKWIETQFLTESRLQNEPNSVEEIHFTPGTPFFAKIKASYSF